MTDNSKGKDSTSITSSPKKYYVEKTDMHDHIQECVNQTFNCLNAPRHAIKEWLPPTKKRILKRKFKYTQHQKTDQRMTTFKNVSIRHFDISNSPKCALKGWLPPTKNYEEEIKILVPYAKLPLYQYFLVNVYNFTT